MNTHFDPSLHAPRTRSATDNAAAEAQRGKLNGIPVAVKDGASLLADAAEEIGLHLSEKIERREHGQRRVVPGRSDRRLSIEQINDYLDKARQHPDAQVRYLQVRDLLQRAHHPSDSLARDTSSSQTATEYYLLLQQALQTALAENAPTAVTERLERALADLEAESGTQVLADLATIDEAASFGDTPQAIASFQGAVHTILDKPTLAQALKEALALADKDGQRLDSAVHHLMNAVGTCLYALGSSREKALLQTLVKDLFHLKCLNTVFAQAKSVVRNVQKTLHQVARAREPGHGGAAP